jgi:hypothetical protein
MHNSVRGLLVTGKSIRSGPRKDTEGPKPECFTHPASRTRA